jgi:DNA primase
VVLAFDSDEAGAKAALRSDELKSPFRLDLDLRVAVMPDGLDPADLVQEGRNEELLKAVDEARPLLEYRIEHEVAKHDLSGPEGRARALHAVAEQLIRVNDEIARREYSRFVARLIGVDLTTVDQATRSRGRGVPARSDRPGRPLDRAESELLRVVLTNPPDMGEIFLSDFHDERLGAAFTAISGELATTAAESPVDISTVSDPDLQGLLRSLVLDSRPLPEWAEMEARVRGRRLDAEIAEIEGQLRSLDSETEHHSETLRHLIALQREKRSLGEE